MRDRFLGAMFGLAYGDAISFPALFHRFQETPRKRHEFLWRTNAELDRQNIIRLMLPYTHRLPAEMLEPSPTDDTEFALFTLRALTNVEGELTQQTFLESWKRDVLPIAAQVRSSFSERAAIENLARGVMPPLSGDHNPLHYEDSAAIRAVPIGLYCVGIPQQAGQIALMESQITNAEDGIYAAQAMAVTVTLLASGTSVAEALSQGRRMFPVGSWIAHVDTQAQMCMREADSPATLALLLTQRIINTVYSFGCAAPETIPAAFALVEYCRGDLQTAVLHANLIPKAADSLPALVGALCGAHQGVDVISPAWRDVLRKVRGLCLPFLKGMDLEVETLRLWERVQKDPYGETARISE